MAAKRTTAQQEPETQAPEVPVLKYTLDEGAYPPERAHATDAGLDLRTPVAVTVPAHGSVVIDTGVHVQLPANTVGMLKSKSGLNVKHGITSEGVIDAGYTGAIKVKLYSHGDDDYVFEAGDKITQLVILPLAYVGELEQVSELDDSDRGDSGFGSTGR
ncbi:dUTP diphosphatase [Bifidobacterium apri]|uniref:dUTP diphosphatase n=1 Tax=Bifidobacterium apri TaxID=1769423 RepID=A0A6A2VG41_9BIFI|nr:dUTP diphosphatase [Bifidobacterium apri]KAB8292073.1 deoxyuridine 5'-triphosphate nucleotidohydrolase [Bifidobacterium apri]